MSNKIVTAWYNILILYTDNLSKNNNTNKHLNKMKIYRQLLYLITVQSCKKSQFYYITNINLLRYYSKIINYLILKLIITYFVNYLQLSYRACNENSYSTHTKYDAKQKFDL